MAKGSELTELTTRIVASFVAHNRVRPAELLALITSIHAALRRAEGGVRSVPAVTVAQSLTHDHIICLNDGAKLKSLKRYIKRKYGLTPEQYRAMWQLPEDYPMVAPAYSERRSQIARKRRAATR